MKWKFAFLKWKILYGEQKHIYAKVKFTQVSSAKPALRKKNA
jgi:hypothetical protein